VKKFLLSALVLIVFIIYVLHVNSGGEAGSTITANTPGIIVPSSAGSTTVTTVSTVYTGSYKNGTYTGSVADAFYGNVQVQVTISGGRISDVQFLQYPNDRRTSQMINSQAMPILKQEAIQAQSAQVSGVSGATATSGAFIQSLGNALQQAS
jgi:uncharacterized protein with FMN-binding domain